MMDAPSANIEYLQAVLLAMVEVDVSRIAWFADLLGQPVEARQLCL